MPTLRELFAIEETTQKQSKIFAKAAKKDTALDEEDIAFLIGCRDSLVAGIETLFETDTDDLSVENIDAMKALLKESEGQKELLNIAISGETVTKKAFKDMKNYDFENAVNFVPAPQVEEVIEELIIEVKTEEALEAEPEVEAAVPAEVE